MFLQNTNKYSENYCFLIRTNRFLPLWKEKEEMAKKSASTDFRWALITSKLRTAKLYERPKMSQMALKSIDLYTYVLNKAP